MANTITLADIRSAADAKYAHTVVSLSADKKDDVTLLNPLRMSKEKRTALTTATAKFKGEDVDQSAVMAEILEIVASTPSGGKALVEAIGDDLAVAMEVVSKYMEGTQAGEA